MALIRRFPAPKGSSSPPTASPDHRYTLLLPRGTSLNRSYKACVHAGSRLVRDLPSTGRSDDYGGVSSPPPALENPQRHRCRELLYGPAPVYPRPRCNHRCRQGGGSVLRHTIRRGRLRDGTRFCKRVVAFCAIAQPTN